MVRTAFAAFARFSSAALLTVVMLSPVATSPAQAQASTCNPGAHPFCYNVQLAGCPTANRVCGFEESSAGSQFACECRNACANSQSCAGNEACFRGNCNPAVACNNNTDCAAAGIPDAACSIATGLCAKTSPPVAPECTTDAQCQTGNACSGTRSCTVAAGRCVAGAPVACLQPAAFVERTPNGGYALVSQHAHCEPVPGSATETKCVITQDSPPVNQCGPDRVDNPNLVIGPFASGRREFTYTGTVQDKSHRKNGKPQVVFIRLANANGADAVLASTAAAGKADASDWHYDAKAGIWQWKRPDDRSPIQSVTLKPMSRERVWVEVRGDARVNDAWYKSVKGAQDQKTETLAYSIETGIGWQRSARMDWQRVTPSCTVVIGGCKQSANGGLNCKVPGWKGGGKS